MRKSSVEIPSISLDSLVDMILDSSLISLAVSGLSAEKDADFDLNPSIRAKRDAKAVDTDISFRKE
jgi:hypothetical protein